MLAKSKDVKRAAEMVVLLAALLAVEMVGLMAVPRDGTTAFRRVVLWVD